MFQSLTLPPHSEKNLNSLNLFLHAVQYEQSTRTSDRYDCTSLYAICCKLFVAQPGEKCFSLQPTHMFESKCGPSSSSLSDCCVASGLTGGPSH